MEEKIIIESKKVNVKKMATIWGIVTAALLLIAFLAIYLPEARYWSDISYGKEILEEIFAYTFWMPLGTSALFFGITVLSIYFNKIVVTDKRVYAEALFGRKIDLSMDEVSAVASGWLGQITIATASGKIRFVFIGNAREIHTETRKLLLKRQGAEVLSEEVSAS